MKEKELFVKAELFSDLEAQPRCSKPFPMEGLLRGLLMKLRCPQKIAQFCTVPGNSGIRTFHLYSFTDYCICQYSPQCLVFL